MRTKYLHGHVPDIAPRTAATERVRSHDEKKANYGACQEEAIEAPDARGSHAHILSDHAPLGECSIGDYGTSTEVRSAASAALAS